MLAGTPVAPTGAAAGVAGLLPPGVLLGAASWDARKSAASLVTAVPVGMLGEGEVAVVGKD